MGLPWAGPQRRADLRRWGNAPGGVARQASHLQAPLVLWDTCVPTHHPARDVPREPGLQTTFRGASGSVSRAAAGQVSSGDDRSTPTQTP